MKTVNVITVISAARVDAPRLDDALLQQISQVDPSVKVKDASTLVAGELRGDPAARKNMDALLAETEVLVGFMPPHDLLKRAPGLKWVQMMSAGVDSLLNSEIWQSRITITGVSGIHATPISEYVLGTILIFAKQSLYSFRMMQKRQWQKFTPQLVRGRTVGIIGLGHIGREVARLARALGMRVLAADEIRGTRPAGNVDKMVPVNQLRKLLADSDFVVSCVPLTPKTSKPNPTSMARSSRRRRCTSRIPAGTINPSTISHHQKVSE